MNIKILIADDHALVREGLKKVLNEESDLDVKAEAASGDEVLEIIKKQKFDIILLDISMPGKSGLDILKAIKEIQPKIRILILSMHPEERFAVRALKLGASGYLTKQSAPEELVNAIRKLLNGGSYISSVLADKLAEEVKSGSKDNIHEKLSNREFEVFRLIATGKTVSQIAEYLSLSIPTVSTYRARILEKMDMKNNAEITYYAIHNSLAE